ncbi:ABC transporter permease [Limnoglobus roseus]|uniref:ABC transporter permease n=1 Tax=Limnoglobus roseus TaxID=2598579 RepID=A0A5C1AF16_9BACT|nr:ABC transporter permease subunit [Limnoglobus roseus]QEL15724.1 ABC transporter permease [Limnoglobus roseus]
MAWLTNPSVLIAGLLLALYQILAALPWLRAIDQKGFDRGLKNPTAISYAVLALGGLGLGFAAFLGYTGQSSSLTLYGKVYGAVLHLQLLVDGFVVVPQLFALVMPKTGAVALAAFRESCRQPMFWLIGGFAVLLMAIAIVTPYFTFGDDYKMMKQIGFDIAKLAAMLFGILAASISISEEIEGRTAITVMSKPINRRQFLFGKFLGILMACGAMTLILGWFLNWALLVNPAYDKISYDDKTIVDTLAEQARVAIAPTLKAAVTSSIGQIFAEGAGFWIADTCAHTVGLALGFGQVMILVAITSALATRLPFVLNIVIELLIYFLGNLAPVVVKVTDRIQEQGESGVGTGLVRFFSQLFDTFLPALDTFNMSPAIVRDTPLPLGAFALYVVSVIGYSILYTVIAMLIGLLLFEDRDLA